MLNQELKIFLLAKEYKEIMLKVEALTEEENALFLEMLTEVSLDNDDEDDDTDTDMQDN